MSTVVQLLSHVQLFLTPWTAPCQASLSFTISWSLFKLMSIKSVMPSNHLVLCRPLLLLPLIFLMSQLFASGGQSIGASASASVLPMNIQDWFLLGLTGWISLQFKGLSRVFSNTTIQKHQFFDAQSSIYTNSHIHKTLALTIQIFVGKVMSSDNQIWVFCSLPAIVHPFLCA